MFAIKKWPSFPEEEVNLISKTFLRVTQKLNLMEKKYIYWVIS